MKEIAYKSEDFNSNYINKNRRKYLIFLEYSLLINKCNNTFYKDKLIDAVHLVNYIITDLNLNIKCVKTFMFNNNESDSVKEKEVKEIKNDIRQAYTTICRYDELDYLLSNLKISFTNPQDIKFFNIEDRIISEQDESVTTRAFTEVINTYEFIKNRDLQKQLENSSGGIFLSETPFKYILILKKNIFDKYIETYLNLSDSSKKQHLDDIDIVDEEFMLNDMLEMFDDEEGYI